MSINDNDINQLWLDAAETWKNLEAVANAFIAKGVDVEWWQYRKIQCAVGYNHCIRKSKEVIF
jgi:hypothetical protein